MYYLKKKNSYCVYNKPSIGGFMDVDCKHPPSKKQVARFYFVVIVGSFFFIFKYILDL